MKGLLVACASLALFVAFCALALRAYRGDRTYQVFLGALGCALVAYVSLYSLLPPDLGFLPRSALEPSRPVDFWNGVFVVLVVFHGMWTFSYMVTGPTIRTLTEVGARRHKGLTPNGAMLQFQLQDAGNAFLRRRLPKLISGGYVAMQNGTYALLPRGQLAGRLITKVKQAMGDIE